MWRLGREVSHSGTHGEIPRAMENCFYLTRSQVTGLRQTGEGGGDHLWVSYSPVIVRYQGHI